MNSSKLSYRAEIDGLRAIAVVSIILYHAKMVFFGIGFEGGFIGVDIFFVISGYLITRIILFELQTKDSFSFLNFYERRARRILPMLFVVIFVSIPYAWQNLLPSDFVEYAESILASLFFGSNFFFYFSATEYGADSALLKPFLHTWSLGVEEQFYLVFPILAIVAFKFFRKYFLTILMALSLLSLQFSELMVVKNSDLNFYLPFSRFWELAVGSLLAYRELSYKTSDEGIASKTLPMLGLYLIIYSILFFDAKTPHPSFHTLIPIIGVALIIGFASKDELVGRVLGSKPFVWMGLISYSAYLWHFPIFAFGRYTHIDLATDQKIEYIFIIFVISIVSYFSVERPFRSFDSIKSGTFLALSILSAMITIIVCSLILGGLIKNPNSDFLIEKLLDRGAFKKEFVEFEVSYDYSVKENDKKNFLIIGNSHAEDLLKTLSFSYVNEQVNLNLWSPKKRERDINYQVWEFDQFLNNCGVDCDMGTPDPNMVHQYSTADFIVLATKWSDKDIDSIFNIIRRVLSDGKQVIVVSNTPESLIFNNRFNRLDHFLFKVKNIERLTGSDLIALEKEFYSDYVKGQSEINQKLKDIVEIFSDERVVYKDRSDYMCDRSEQMCYLYFPKDEAKVLWDYGHITTDGARVLGRLITERMWLADLLH